MPLLHAVLDRAQHLFVPQRFDLAYNAVKGRILGSGEPESRCLKQLANRFRTAVDIGANRGEYTFEMSRLFEVVWSFEPNPEVSAPIRSANLKNVHLVNIALSSIEGTGALSVPIVAGKALHGWGSLDWHDRGDVNNKLEVELRTLDAFNISDVDLIKVDVEGHELSTLQGANETIDRWRPLCLVELADINREDVLGYFHARDYEAHTHWNGVEISDHNRLFVPKHGARF